MAYDLKYGNVTLERGNIGENEPVFIFRGQDKLLLGVLAHYLKLCVREGSPEVHLNNISKNYDVIARWQQDNNTRIPESASGEI